MQKKYSILGMSCAACSSAVERALLSVPLVLKAEVSLLTNSASVTLPEGFADDQPLYDAVKRAGYTLLPYAPPRRETKEKKGFLFYRLLFSILLLIPLFYLCMGPMLHLPFPEFLHERRLNTALQIALVLPITILNFKYYTVGYPRLFRGHPNMDSLIAVGATASLLYSAYASVMIFAFGDEKLTLYYESAGMILTFITIGKYMEARTKKKTGRTIEGLLSLTPETATVVKDGTELTVPTAELQAGDLLLLRPGEHIPADGTVEEGDSAVDESSMTGESIPRDVTAGDALRAGTVNLSGTLYLRAEKVAGDTTISKMIALVEQASASKAPVGRLADKISGIFVPIIMAIALVSAAVWLFAVRDFGAALKVGVTVLVIACPCSLGLATPAAIMAGTGKGAECGILFESAEALENCGKATTVVFDKTGTLTEGRPYPKTILVREGGENDFLQMLASLEHGSEHPLAKAICAEAENRGLTLLPCADFKALPGKGVYGTVAREECAALSPAQALILDPSFALTPSEERALYGQTVVVFFKNKKALGAVGLSDRVRSDAAQTVAALKIEGVSSVLLTGDRAESAETAAKEAGIDRVISRVLPEDKEKKIAELIDKGEKAAMVGDGVNDAPALARAYVGFAMGSGTDIAVQSADVVLMNDRTLGVCNALLLSKKTLRIIRQNLFFAFFYNCVGVTLAVAGIANPIIAAAAMSLSSFCVLSNALRLRRFKPLQSGCAANCAAPEKTENKNESEEQTVKKTIEIEGMMCMHCVAHVRSALEKTEGVESVEVSLEEKRAVVTLKNDLPDKTLADAVTNAGYKVTKII